MTEADAKAKDVASRALSDIDQLKNSEPFLRYFIGRMRRNRDAIEERFRTAPPKEVDKDEREILRRLIQEYDEQIIDIMPRDEAAFLRTLESLSRQ